MRRPIVLVTLSMIVSSTLAGCAAIETGSTSPTPTPAPPTLTGLTVSGLTGLTTPGQTTQLTARVSFSDGSAQDVTTQAAWQTSNTAVATVSPTGLVTSVTFGQTDVTAAFQRVSGKVTINLPLDLTGLWRGTGTDPTGSSTFAVGITQHESAIAGNVTITSNGRPGGGTFSGTVANVGDAVTFTIVVSSPSGSGTCLLTLNAAVRATATTLTGTYAGTDSCAGNIGNGTLTLARQ